LTDHQSGLALENEILTLAPLCPLTDIMADHGRNNWLS